MMKYVRYGIILAIACLGFIIIDDVYASSYQVQQVSITYNDRALTNNANNFVSPAGLRTITTNTSLLRLGGSYDDNLSDYATVDIYYKLNLCVDSTFSSYSFTSPVKNVYVNNSAVPCGYNNSSYTGGRIVEILYTVNTKAPQLTSSFTVNQDKVASIQIISIQASLETAFSFDYASLNVTSSQLNETNNILNGVNQAQNETNSAIKDTDTSGADDTAGGFFDSFEDSDYGLSDIITMPLNTIKNITSATCSPLSFPLPFVNKNMELPCMTTVYSHFGPILAIYQTITFGMIAYWVVVNIFATVRNFKNPDSDEIEVISL